MSAVINGNSCAALKFFREEPAALAVYWAYCAHMNAENIAWRGLRSLETETGWTVNAVKKARVWLIKHELLERVEEYTPKKWRKLEPEAQQQAKMRYYNEYYRVCPTLVIDGEEYSMLYTPQDDSGEDNEEGVSPHDTGGVAQGDTQNLIPKVLVKDSAANNAADSAANETNPPRTDKPKHVTKQDPWYDNILATWGYHAGANGDMRKFLQGTATKKGWKEYSPPPGYTLTDATEICHFAAWYRNTHQSGKRDLSMVAERGKLQSAIIEWVDAGRPTGDAGQYRTERLFT
jgi:hypothetical protein